MKIIAAIPKTFWLDRLNVSGEMAIIEGENAGMAGVASRGFLMKRGAVSRHEYGQTHLLKPPGW